MIAVNIAFRYLSYKLFSGHKYGHGVHSPFVYGFIKNVLNQKTVLPEIHKIEHKRKEYQLSRKIINTENPGAGSRVKGKKVRTLGKIVRNSSVNKKYGRMLFHLVNYYNPDMIVELGTSAGISTLYLAMADKQKKIITIEGNRELASCAEESFRHFGLHKIEIFTGDFDEVLPKVLKECSGRILFYIDGNHTGKATLKYFNICSSNTGESLMVFDDINWSDDMYQSWKKIKSDARVKISINLFRMGIILTGKKFQSEHFVIRY